MYLKDSWAQAETFSPINLQLLDPPLTLESPNNQQLHDRVYSVISLLEDQFLTISQKQIRKYRVKDRKLRFQVIGKTF